MLIINFYLNSQCPLSFLYDQTLPKFALKCFCYSADSNKYNLRIRTGNVFKLK